MMVALNLLYALFHLDTSCRLFLLYFTHWYYWRRLLLQGKHVAKLCTAHSFII